MLEFNGKQIETDKLGYLKNIEDWSEDLVFLLAQEEEIILTQQHWDVIYLVRDFYFEYNTSPAVRLLVKAMNNRYGSELGNSQYLFSLFPKGPAKQATKLAGLPKPIKCL